MKKRTCKICGKNREVFLYAQPPRQITLLFISIWNTPSVDLCVEHFISEFTRRFLEYPHKMVVFTPYLQIKETHVTYGYEFFPVKEGVTSTLFRGSELEIWASLKAISGNCQTCGREARVAFFDKEAILWRGEIAVPYAENTSPNLLCKECAAERLKGAWQEYAKYFEDGIWCPWGGEGGFFPRAH